MENMNKGLTVPIWLLILWPRITLRLQNLPAQFVYPSPKVVDFNKKGLHWGSIVRVFRCHNLFLHCRIDVGQEINIERALNNFHKMILIHFSINLSSEV